MTLGWLLGRPDRHTVISVFHELDQAGGFAIQAVDCTLKRRTTVRRPEFDRDAISRDPYAILEHDSGTSVTLFKELAEKGTRASITATGSAG
jgi:hypothetical protein